MAVVVPRYLRRACFGGDGVAGTVRSRTLLHHWIVNVPTPPAPAWMRTFLPAVWSGTLESALSVVCDTVDTLVASWNDTVGGMMAQKAASTGTYCARAPQRVCSIGSMGRRL